MEYSKILKFLLEKILVVFAKGFAPRPLTNPVSIQEVVWRVVLRSSVGGRRSQRRWHHILLSILLWLLRRRGRVVSVCNVNIFIIFPRCHIWVCFLTYERKGYQALKSQVLKEKRTHQDAEGFQLYSMFFYLYLELY